MSAGRRLTDVIFDPKNTGREKLRDIATKVKTPCSGQRQ
jgi:hypothetical protein